MRFVVTGGAGFFGSVLLDFLSEAGHEVLSIDCINDKEVDARYYTAQVDVADRDALKKAIQAFGKVDGIFHLAAVLAHDPGTRPQKLKKGPAPRFHAATAEMRRLLWEAYAEFVAKFRDAAEKLRAGDRNAVFPPGCFPPALPFVPG